MHDLTQRYGPIDLLQTWRDATLVFVLLVLATPFVFFPLAMVPGFTAELMEIELPKVVHIAFLFPAVLAVVAVWLAAWSRLRPVLATEVRLADKGLVFGRVFPVIIGYDQIRLIEEVPPETPPGPLDTPRTTLVVEWAEVRRRFPWTMTRDAFRDELRARCRGARFRSGKGHEAPPPGGWNPERLAQRRIHLLREARFLMTKGVVVTVMSGVSFLFVDGRTPDPLQIFVLYTPLLAVIAGYFIRSRRVARLARTVPIDQRPTPASAARLGVSGMSST